MNALRFPPITRDPRPQVALLTDGDGPGLQRFVQADGEVQEWITVWDDKLGAALTYCRRVIGWRS